MESAEVEVSNIMRDFVQEVISLKRNTREYNLTEEEHNSGFEQIRDSFANQFLELKGEYANDYSANNFLSYVLDYALYAEAIGRAEAEGQWLAGIATARETVTSRVSSPEDIETIMDNIMASSLDFHNFLVDYHIPFSEPMDFFGNMEIEQNNNLENIITNTQMQEGIPNAENDYNHELAISGVSNSEVLQEVGTPIDFSEANNGNNMGAILGIGGIATTITLTIIAIRIRMLRKRKAKGLGK